MTDPTLPTASVLTVSGLAAHIGGQQVVEQIDFEVPAQGVTAVLGRNGVGKTSTIKAILGLIDRTGEVWLAGHRIDQEPTHRIVQRGVGYVPEDREVFGTLTVAENLKLAIRSSEPRTELVESLFPELVKRAQQRAGTLSGGQQQMVSVARALINPNQLLLIDEPTKGLAPKIVNEVADVLAEATRTTPVLLVEQNLPVVEKLAERVVVIDSGRVVHAGSAADLFANPDMIQRFLGVHAEETS